MKYTKGQLIRAIVADLANDVRLAEGRDAGQDGMAEYAAKCRQQLAAVFRNRHGVQLDRNGWPKGIAA